MACLKCLPEEYSLAGGYHLKWRNNLVGLGWFDRTWIRYGITIGAVAAGFLLRLIMTEYVGPGLPTYVTFYPAVMFAATVFGFRAGLLATAMAALISAYWILPPEGFAVNALVDVVGLALFSAMGVFIGVTGGVYRRLRKQVQERTAELAKANEALRDLSSKLLSAQEDERKRIAGEIHDTLGGCLNAIKFRVEDALGRIGKSSDTGAESLKAVTPVISEGIEECRRMQQNLRPSILDDLGLLATLSWFCRTYQTIYTGIKVDLEPTLEESDIPPALKIVIFRITQEGMNNIAKHSKAHLVHLSLRKMDGRIRLILEDDGQGFNLKKELRSDNRGLGLTSMRERTELSGGSFSIESTEGKGTTVRASWPLSEGS